MTVRRLVTRTAALQRSQVSVQALTRLASVCLFLLASWWDTTHLPLVVLQGALFALPYALMEALVGRPLAADLVPDDWDLGRWARSVATVAMLPVAVVNARRLTAGRGGPAASS